MELGIPLWYMSVHVNIINVKIIIIVFYVGKSIAVKKESQPVKEKRGGDLYGEENKGRRFRDNKSSKGRL